jgi:3-phenylpropionate/trans-cinnamate dioxygenase ferredoxin subunit
MELRETKSSSYTLRDTPTFTCISMPLAEALLSLGAPGDVVLPAADRVETSFPVAMLDDLPEGTARVVHYQGDQIALFHVAGRVYATSNRCSHANGPLAEGKLEGTQVTCPWHDSKFDLLTGNPCGGPAQRPVATYDVRIEDGAIYLAEKATAITAS